MNRRFWSNMKRLQEGIILGSTSLKMKVVLYHKGVAVENALCSTVNEVKAWSKAKYDEWAAIGQTVTFKME